MTDTSDHGEGAPLSSADLVGKFSCSARSRSFWRPESDLSSLDRRVLERSFRAGPWRPELVRLSRYQESFSRLLCINLRGLLVLARVSTW